MAPPRRPRRAPRKPRASKPRRAAPRRAVPRRRVGVPKRQLIQANLGGISMTRFKAGRRANRVVKSILTASAPNYLNLTYSWNIQSATGSQQVSSAFIANRNDLMRLWASIVGSSVSPNATTGLPVPNYNGGIKNSSFRWALSSVYQVLHFANTGATPVNIELYDIATTKNGPVVPYDLSGNVYKDVFSQGGQFTELNPTNAWLLGTNSEALTETGFGINEKPSINDLGASPLNSQMFRRYFKIVRKTNLTLPIGGQHKHLVDLKSNYMIDNLMLSESSCMAGLSFYTMLVVSGVPVVACPTSTQPTVPDVNVSPTSVSVVQTLKYKYGFVADTSTAIYKASYLQTGSNYQSVQPAFNKIEGLGSSSGPVIVPASDTPHFLLPSDCTRVDALGNKIVDCGCA